MATAQDLLEQRTKIQDEIVTLKKRIQTRMYEANFNLEIAGKGQDAKIEEIRAQIKPLAQQVKDINTRMAALSTKGGGSRSRSRSRSRSKGRRSRKQGQGRKTRRSRL